MNDETRPRATGRCHCGAVRFEVRGPLRDVLICHCEDCRRIHGHVAAHTATRWDDLTMTEARGLKWYASSDKARRAFCTECGAGIFFDLHGRDIVSICAGTLDPPTRIRTAMHVFVDSASDYETGDAEAPRRPDLPTAGDSIDFRD
jgi:hypothetical protein